MNKLLNSPFRITFNIILLLLSIVILAVILVPVGEIGLILLLLTIIIGVIGLLIGIVAALGLTLLLYFLIGSSYFWLAFTNNLMIDGISNVILLIWMVTLLFIALLTGRIAILMKDLSLENVSLKEEVRELVAVDPVTGFDNKERLYIELESEFNRSKRYEQTFLFLLLKIDHLEQFKKLYGENEYMRMLQHLARGIHNNTRSSDLKFRPEVNLFALILPHTPSEHSELIIEKLNRALRTFQLQNKKYVTLNFQFGYVGFDHELTDFLTIYEQAKEQVSLNVT